MKTEVAVLTFVALFPLAALRARDARMLEGAHLDEPGQTRLLQDVTP